MIAHKTKTLFILCCIALTACGEPNTERLVPASSGRINHLSVILDNDLWEGRIGKAIRDSIGEAVYGLPQDEPSFSMKQLPTNVFTGFARNSRAVLKIEKDKTKETAIKIYDNPYAKPQKMIVISGKTNKDIITQLYANKLKIISTFKNQEVIERQRRTKKSLHKQNNIEAKLGIRIEFPSAYRIAKEEDTFFWIRRDIETGTLNLVLYEMPLHTISKGDEAINNIIAMRDSISKLHIPGPSEGDYMLTDDNYWPFIGNTILDNKPTIETKSTWIVKNAFMSGPFINYVIEDAPNNRLLVLEGFVFAPSVLKRDFVFELESIIKSIQIN